MNRNRERARPPHGGREERRRGSDGAQIIEIFGIHAALAALANPARRILNVAATGNAANRLAEALKARSLSVTSANPRDLDRRLGPEAVHQGVLVEAEPLPVPALDELVDAAKGPIIVLDQVTDPHNVGAILRSGAAFGAGGLVMTERHSPPLAGALAKAASGALELVPVALVPNLARALAELGQFGVERVGLDGEGKASIEDIGGGHHVALVLGAEGRGLRHLTREHCDRLARIPTTDAFPSLNVSNAVAVALYALSKAKGRR